MATTAMFSLALFASSSLAAPIAFVAHSSSNHRPARSIDQVDAAAAVRSCEVQNFGSGRTPPILMWVSCSAGIVRLREILGPLVNSNLHCWNGERGWIREDNGRGHIQQMVAAANLALGTSRFRVVDDNDLGVDTCTESAGLIRQFNAWLASPAPTTAAPMPAAALPMKFGKVNEQSTTSNPGGSGAKFSYPITRAVIDRLPADSDAESMRAFGYQQLNGTSWSDVLDWITPISAPIHAGSIGADAITFWGDFEQVVDLQAVRKQSGTTSMVSDYLISLPTMFANHTVSAAAEEVEMDFPTKFPTNLTVKFLREKVGFDATVVPHTGDDFVNKVVMLADVIGWAVSIVSPTAFAAKWQNGRARPEEVAWAVHSGDARVASAPAAVESKIRALELTNGFSFTAYVKGSPKHPSWPAMHSAASSASLYLAVLLNLTPAQLAEARSLDCAVASFRTLAGVHYESDNMAGLSIGQEVIRRELPLYLQERYGSVPANVTAKIDRVIAAHDWRIAESCFKPQASWPSTDWTMAEGHLSCDEVCSERGSSCDGAAINSLTTQDRVFTAFAAAGFTCQVADTSCETSNGGNNCDRWGSPYLYNQPSYLNQGRCFYGLGSPHHASCSQRVVDGNHRRLCPCE